MHQHCLTEFQTFLKAGLVKIFQVWVFLQYWSSDFCFFFCLIFNYPWEELSWHLGWILRAFHKSQVFVLVNNIAKNVCRLEYSVLFHKWEICFLHLKRFYWVFFSLLFEDPFLLFQSLLLLQYHLHCLILLILIVQMRDIVLNCPLLIRCIVF